MNAKNECFFITPIGAEGSPERERADGVLDVIVNPAAKAVGLEAVRADRLGEPGQITRQVVDHVLTAKAAVADLTGRNPNVFWELGVRHAFQLPVVLIAQEGEDLPFDVFSMRTVFYDSQSLASAAKARDAVAAQLRSAMDGAVESPVSTSIDLASLQRGSSLERSVADLVSHVQELAAEQRNQASRVASLQDALRIATLEITRRSPSYVLGSNDQGFSVLLENPPFKLRMSDESEVAQPIPSTRVWTTTLYPKTTTLTETTDPPSTSGDQAE